MTGERLELRYVPLSTLRQWDRNPKPHDVDLLIESYERYGFKDPPKFEPTLNDEAGGLVEGNGRFEALDKMRRRGDDPPRGVAELDGGDWAVPVLFGVDARSRSEAEAYALDHNAIGLAGGHFAPDWASLLYDGAGLVSVLRDHQEAGEAWPLTIGEEAWKSLGRYSKDYAGETGPFDATKLAGAADGGQVKTAYLIYVSFERSEDFVEGLRLLSLGERTTIKDGMTMAVLNGGDHIDGWREGLGGEAE